MSVRTRIIWVFMVVVCIAVGLILASQFALFKQENKNENPDALSDITQKKVPLDYKDYEDWRVACVKTSGQCQMFQRLSTQKRNQVLLMAIVTHIEKEGKKLPVIRFITPIGVELPVGLGFRIDEQKAKNVAFKVCGPGGCIAEFGFNDTLLSNLKKSKNMIITFKLAGQKPISVAVSLKGFSEAFDSLKQSLS